MSDETSNYIATQLRRVRKQKGLTQVALAKLAGVNDNYYARLERAEVSPTIDMLEKIVKSLDVKSSEILPF